MFARVLLGVFYQVTLWVLIGFVIRGFYQQRARVRPQSTPQLEALTPLLQSFIPFWATLVTGVPPQGNDDVEGGSQGHDSEAASSVGTVETIDNPLGDHEAALLSLRNIDGIDPVGLEEAFDLSNLSTATGYRTPGSMDSASNMSASVSNPTMPPVLRLPDRSGLFAVAGIRQPLSHRGAPRGGRGRTGQPPIVTRAGFGGLFGASCPGVHGTSDVSQ